MPRSLAAVGLLLTSLAAAAQESPRADLAVTMSGFAPAVRTGEYIRGEVVITNHGPAPAGVRLEVSAPAIRGGYIGGSYLCTGERKCGPFDLAAGETKRINLSFFYAPATAGRITIAAEVSSVTPDPDPSNNRTAVEMDVLLLPDLYARVEAQPGYQPEGIGTITVAHFNHSEAGDATGVVVTVEFPEDVVILGRTGDERFHCEIGRNRAVCRAEVLPATRNPPDYPRSHFTFRVPPLYDGGTFTVSATIRGNEPDPDLRSNATQKAVHVFKFFRVTTTADDGPGSLREAILAANGADCRERCTVGFRIPDPLPASGYFTVRPQSPLPPVRFDGFVLGSAQKDLPGHEGASPRVMIDGSLVSSGDGLVLERSVDVDGLAIGNFPRFGVFVEPRVAPRLDGVYLGVDGSGRTAAPNFRGLVTNRAGVIMTNCVVSGNVRSGIVMDAGTLKNNRIGVAADSDLPMPNGASGVYLPGRGDASLSQNVIAYNREFAVAIEAGLRRVTLAQNSIFGNGFGIDYGLDGPTANAFDRDRFPNHPTIESALFDAATNQTIITVRLATNAIPSLFPDAPPGLTSTSLTFAAELYANRTPQGQAERFLGRVEARCHCRAISETRTLAIDGDLRGQWISAVGTRGNTDCYLDMCSAYGSTSETSPTVAVQ